MNNNKNVALLQPHSIPYYQGSICISLVHEALHHAVRTGIDVKPLLERSAIPLTLFNSHHARVSVTQYGQLWIELANCMNDEFFGMDSRPLKRGSYQLLSKWIKHADNLQSALQDSLNFFNLLLDDIRGELTLDNQFAYIFIHDCADIKPMFTYATYFMLIHSLMCWLSGQRIHLHTLQVRSKQPQAHHDYQNRFCHDIHYQCQHNFICFPREILTMKIKKDAQAWHHFLQETPYNLLVRFKNPHAFSQKIRQHLLIRAPCDWLELTQLALCLNMSETTIQRHLRNEGVTYQQLKNNIRRDIAIELLTHSQKSLQHISEQLHFHDASAFHRAFKKWTGLSPGSYRNRSLL